VFIAAGRSGFVTLVASIGLAVNVVLSIFMVEWMGPSGAAWATVISIYAMTICSFVAIGSILKCRLTDVVRAGRVGGTVAAACIPGAAVYLLGLILPGSALIRLSVLTPVFAILLIITYHITGIVPLRRILDIVLRKAPTAVNDAKDIES